MGVWRLAEDVFPAVRSFDFLSINKISGFAATFMF